MILYRDITYDEYDELCNGKVKKKINIYGSECNTFNYKEDEYIIHFFRYLRHAKSYIDLFGEMIIEYEIPDDKIVDYGFGRYQYGFMNDSVAIPEVIIRRDDYVLDNITAINPDRGYDLEASAYDILIKELYKDWKKRKQKKTFYEYLVEYFRDVDLDAIINVYTGKKKRRRLIKEK